MKSIFWTLRNITFHVNACFSYLRTPRDRLSCRRSVDMKSIFGTLRNITFHVKTQCLSEKSLLGVQCAHVHASCRWYCHKNRGLTRAQLFVVFLMSHLPHTSSIFIYFELLLPWHEKRKIVNGLLLVYSHLICLGLTDVEFLVI